MTDGDCNCWYCLVHAVKLLTFTAEKCTTTYAYLHIGENENSYKKRSRYMQNKLCEVCEPTYEHTILIMDCQLEI